MPGFRSNARCAWRWCVVGAVIGNAIVFADRLLADAMVVTQAMKASTIAEVSIAEDQIRVEFEIGVEDIEAFQNVLPDELFEKLTGEKNPFDRRLRTFLDRDWLIKTDGQQLAGVLESIVPAKRIVRDEITGEPLPDQPEGAEIVIRVALRYPLKSLPQLLSIRPPMRDRGSTAVANIGFVAYHNELPVNDFRYLSNEATLELNWDDPWYSRFRNRNLRRQYAAPMSAFLYVEPFEVRKEIIVRPKDLQNSFRLDLGLDDTGVIPVDRQTELKRRIGDFLGKQSPVRIDGRVIEGHLDRIHFVRRSLRRTGIVDPPEDLDVTSATLGVIFVYPIDGLPQEVTMRWELFDERIKEIPAAATDEAGPLPATLSLQDPVLRWRNFLKNPTIPTFATIAAPPVAPMISIPVVTLICVIVLVPLGVMIFRSYERVGRLSRSTPLVWMAVAIVGGLAYPHARVAVARPFASPALLSDEAAAEVLGGLLHNVYRAFDKRDQSLIYDQLARSIAGDLLEQVYLDTRKSIEVENQGGLQIKVDEVEILELQRISASQSKMTFHCHWRVSGSVGHWGHIHRRVNEPTAQITIAASDRSWKIVAMEMIPQPISPTE